MKITNRSAGPKTFNVKGDGDVVLQRVLGPGESADLELLNPKNDKAYQGWLKDGLVAEGEQAAKAQAESPTVDLKKLAALEEQNASLQEELAKLREAQAAAQMDAARRTPPAQLGGDGGKEQMPTVDGNPGAPTPNQQGGTTEQKGMGKAK